MRLIEDLLDVSRIISGKLHMDVGPGGLRRGHRVGDRRDPAGGPGQADRHRGGRCGRAASIIGDADRLRQAVWNLLSNAVKFTPQGGRVIVSTAVSETACELTVRDNGVGIPAEFLPYVFDRFRQADGR